MTPLRRRIVLGGGGVVVGFLLVTTVLSSWVWGQALQPTCMDVPRADLSLQEMVDVKLLVDEAQRSGSNELTFSGSEASFVLREVMRLPVSVQIDGSSVHVLAAIPYRDQCYNVDYSGSVRVDGALAEVHPESFRLGGLDLTGWVDGPIDLEWVSWLSTPAAEGIAHLERLDFLNGRAIVKVDDVGAIR